MAARAGWSASPFGRARAAGLAAIAVLGVAYAIPLPDVGWNQTAHYALVRALADGSPRIDETRFQTGSDRTEDISVVDGHTYAAKAPGLAFASLVPYLILKAAGGADPVPDPAGRLWYLNVWGSLLPVLGLLLLVRYVGGRLEPGFGAAAAVTLGVATMVLPFATLYFAHALSAMLVFAAFVVLWRQRQGAPRPALVACAGVLAGLAATTEFPVAAIGALLGVYALRRGAVLRCAAAYAGGALLGGLPTLAYNRWAFGDPFAFPYANVDGANNAGFYGVAAPKLHVLAQLLLDRIGLFTLMPVLVLAALGLVGLFRCGHRAEAVLAGAISITYLLLIAGYEDPFGGWSPGPRFLVAVLPFLALGLPSAYRRFPLTTTALAICSAVQMVAITLTRPLHAVYGDWFHRFATGDFGSTSLGLVGVGEAVVVPLFLLAVTVAVALAVLATPPVGLSVRDGATAALAVAGWMLAAHETPQLLGTTGSWAALALAGAIVAAVVLAHRAVAAVQRGQLTSAMRGR